MGKGSGFETLRRLHNVEEDFMRTLVLTHSYQPVKLVDWQKAVYFIITGKADMLVASEEVIRSISMQIVLPKVVILRRNVRLEKRKVKAFNKRDVFIRDNWTCQYCDRKLSESQATADHVIPKSRGGANRFDNVVCACQSCNGKKANRTPAEAGMVLKTLPTKPEWGSESRADLQRAYEEFMKEFAS